MLHKLARRQGASKIVSTKANVTLDESLETYQVVLAH